MMVVAAFPMRSVDLVHNVAASFIFYPGIAYMVIHSHVTKPELGDVSALMEWILVVFLALYILTFVDEFSRIRLDLSAAFVSEEFEEERRPLISSDL
ncbi:unnamed protein product [Darwinula stevensoni]|uniref:Uncharacterized protein n=1 Tax=Darwinula stevensoni TaxID=69355 RepID=A0A7R8XA67_9CRUS|nr:unnamed protein product [Darwinula stevensoni]CAG0883426.1 unnamed protein product [Darwinula stevensoni]